MFTLFRKGWHDKFVITKCFVESINVLYKVGKNQEINRSLVINL